MGKKKLDVMAKEREYFIHGQTDEEGNVIIPGCVRNGIDEKSADKIFDEMAEFAKYAFNKSHAAAYAVVSYRTAYLKAYYPEEFMAATLNSFLGNLDKIPMYIDECRRLNIPILKPDINHSYTKFTVNEGKIRFGLGSVKNVGIQAVENIVKERQKNGIFKSFTDFCERVQGEAVNKKCIESLIKAGAFDEFEQTRSTLMASFENILDTIDSSNKKSFQGQVTMFDISEENNKEELKYKFLEQEEYTDKELLTMEKEMLGIYVSGHPLEKMRKQISIQTNIDTMKMSEISEQMSKHEKTFYKDGQNVKYAGIINSVKKKYTKNNTIMAFITVEDLYGQAEIICFEQCYLKSQTNLVENNVILIEGRLSIREDEEPKIIANNITTFEKKKEKRIKININGLEEEKKAKLRGLLKFFSGDKNNIPVFVEIKEETKPCGMIYLTEEIKKQIEEIVGTENVSLGDV